MEDVDEVVENNGACDEPSKSLQTLARVAVNHLEEGTRAGEPIDLKHSNSVDHDPEKDTSDDDYYDVIVDNNNNTDLGHEEVEILTDDDKENEPVIKTGGNIQKRCFPGSKTAVLASKIKKIKSVKEATTVGKIKVMALEKKSKAEDPQKDPPTLVANAVPQSRNAFATAFLDASNNNIESKDYSFHREFFLC